VLCCARPSATTLDVEKVIDMTNTVPAPGGRIVVGVDGSVESKLALRWAARIAAATGATIEAVTAWHFPVNFGWSCVPDAWNPETDAVQCLGHLVDDVFPAGRPAGLRLVVREGLPAKILLEESRGAMMLLVGSRGHGGVTGLLLGSVSASCAEHATCPVLVVHGGAEELATLTDAVRPVAVPAV
jgi:nucleotide-binding universal stress UspA family protein